MIEVFLSASVPLPERNRIYFETADVFLIRESIRALVEVVLPKGRITFGGHPAITPLMSLYARNAKLGNKHITIYQSDFFRGEMPRENDDFADIRYTAKVAGGVAENLALMRSEMLRSRKFDAAVLIGGMEGIRDEASMFKELHPQAKVLPVPATGAAARIEFLEGDYPDFLKNEISFASLFRRALFPSPLAE
ncbi:hypothetical protein N7E70_017445 [Aminobacter sp. NyZ550]|uniref:SLOG domain-containing protein n=1 Tax=Aminobacter sp. NyZ550 TaxID=2979870 RepID=UPI0021D56C5D|nr:hypothetical protein [Aminobacter sp. NyZ550]WAX93466.1 hypothetical protein N7E70_017445 [Aminobacter sp. NyZ550]